MNAICRVIETETVRNQNDIIEKLKQCGLIITQASLSRYLKEIQASRVPDGTGGYVYKVPSQNIPHAKSQAVLANEIISVEFAGNIVVLKTLSGYAAPVSVQIDSKTLPSVAGTVCGDDTIFIAIRDGFSREDMKQTLIKEFPYIKDKIL